jgi:hypothetical protein
VGRKRREERDLRSLDRERMHSIFGPVDDQPPAAGGTGFEGRNTITGPFTPDLDDPLWKTLLTWVWLPALVLFLTLEIWVGIPQVAAWLIAIGFTVGYGVLGWVAYRKRRG